jgi:hypothetical protein
VSDEALDDIGQELIIFTDIYSLPSGFTGYTPRKSRRWPTLVECSYLSSWSQGLDRLRKKLLMEKSVLCIEQLVLSILMPSFESSLIKRLKFQKVHEICYVY